MTMHEVALVAIGRNEGDRLVKCLQSAQGQVELIVYVDSASQDGSGEVAKRLGAEVVDLDMSRPFSAARARNEGWRRARQLRPDISLIQFVDGDCALAPGWLAHGIRFLGEHPDVVAVCGRRRERFPTASIYNQLCDNEWNTPIGETRAFGGDVLIRASALDVTQGYRDDVIAGEEPELCIRILRQGGRLFRLDHDMTWHDAAITHFRPWWTRTVRCGYAYAMGASLHGAAPERHWVKERNRALAWGLLLPLAIASSALVAPPVALCLGLAYPLQMGRLALRSTLRGPKWSAVDGALKVIGKFAEARGVIKFIQDEWQGRAPKIIEYK
jgi:glycosyltransferase involved in cell wall biosynthesis